MKQARARENDRVRSLEVIFVGGPYDGHKATCFTQVVQLPTDLVCLVCEDAVRLLNGEPGRRSGVMSSVAFYELVFDDGTPRYRFAGAVPIDELSDLISHV